MKRRRELVAGVYTTFVMLMNTWSVMLTVLVLNLHHRNECRPIPAWLRIVAFEGLARLLCMYTQQHVLVYQHRIQQRRHTSPGAASSRPCDAAHRRPRHSLHEINEYWRRAEHKPTPSRPRRSADSSAGTRDNGDAPARTFLPKKTTEKASWPGGMSAVSSVLSAATRTGFMAATAGASHHQAAALKLINGQLVQCTDSTSTVEAPADTAEDGEDGEVVEPDAVIINLELQEWKRLARIMDRLFFWMTLTALISISVVLSCLLIWQQ